MTYLKARLPFISILLVALLTMLFSASCGCGSGSTGPSAPVGAGVVSDPIESWPYPPYDPIVAREPSTFTSDVLHQKWSIGTNFIREIGFNRVEWSDSGLIEDWGKLVFSPYNRPYNQTLPADMAYAVYGLPTYNFSVETFYPVYIELDWYQEPLMTADVWVGVHTEEDGESRWIWEQPYSDMTVPLSPLWMYQSRDPYRTVYIAVVVTAGEPCVLQEIALRQYRW